MDGCPAAAETGNSLTIMGFPTALLTTAAAVFAGTEIKCSSFPNHVTFPRAIA
jgi:hypothetical protein